MVYHNLRMANIRYIYLCLRHFLLEQKVFFQSSEFTTAETTTAQKHKHFHQEIHFFYELKHNSKSPITSLDKLAHLRIRT